MFRPTSSVKPPQSPINISTEPPEAAAAESNFVVALASLLCALISVVGLISVARCAWLSPSGAAARTRLRRRMSANRGLKKKVLQSFPKFTYDSSSLSASTTTDCAICLSDYVDGDEIRVLPACDHGFHVLCIDTWLGSHSTCPTCRRIIAVTEPCRKGGDRVEASGGGDGIAGPAEIEVKSRQDPFGASSSVGV